MKFLIFNGSLKPDGESNTFAVCQMLQLAFDKLGHECEIITLRDLDYEGATADIDDEFLITIHHWMKWYKFGFTRLWDNLSLEIRNGKLTRKKAS